MPSTSPIHSLSRALALLALAASVACSLTGCGSGVATPTPIPPVTPPPVTPPPVTTFSGVTFTGKVLAATQPIDASSVQIYAAAVTGTTSTPTPLLTTPLTTDTTGAFTVPAAYPCPAATSQLYLVARGGQVGTAPANAAIALIAPLGTCGQITPNSTVVLNEVTTATTAWALAQFLTPTAQLTVSATNGQGIANAVATVASLANLTTGATPGPTFPSTGTAPTARINSLANLLNACTAWNGTGTNPCSPLFAATTTSSSTPTDTLAAAINLVQHPALNVATLYTLSQASTAFAPVLTKAPADWTLFVNFTGGGLSSPSSLAVDSSGNIWVASYFSPNSINPSGGSATQFSPTGVPLFPNGITGFGLHNAYGLAIDAQNNVWIPNEASPGSINSGLGSVTELNSAGQSISGANGFTTGGLDFPIAVAIDPNGTTWVVDYGNSHLTQFNPSGQPLSGAAGYTSQLFAFPDAIAIDANHNAWIGNQGSGSVTKVSPDGATATNFACCDSAAGLAIDQRGYLWIANYYGNSVSQLSTTSGTVISNGGYTASNTIDHPQGIAIDGNGNIWIANYRNTYLTQLAGSAAPAPGATLSPLPGWAPDAALLEAFALAIDSSGNIWVSNQGSNTLTEFVGIAAPVKTPLAIAPQTP